MLFLERSSICIVKPHSLARVSRVVLEPQLTWRFFHRAYPRSFVREEYAGCSRRKQNEKESGGAHRPPRFAILRDLTYNVQSYFIIDLFLQHHSSLRDGARCRHFFHLPFVFLRYIIDPYFIFSSRYITRVWASFLPSFLT